MKVTIIFWAGALNHLDYYKCQIFINIFDILKGKWNAYFEFQNVESAMYTH